jgi:DNA-binding transcriptional LysR family regulator
MNPARLDHLRLKHLRFVELLASEGSLTATAERLALTPSAASMMLKEIEGLFGAKLFQRQGRGMAPTAQGLALLPRCRTVLGEVSAIRDTLQGGGAPLLRIGAFPHTTTTVLPGIVQRLAQGSPAWRLQIVDGSADHLLQQLLAGGVDLLLGRLPQKGPISAPPGELTQRVLYQGELAIVASRHHPLAGRPSLSLDDLRPWSWVLPGPHSTTRTALVDLFVRQGLEPPVPAVESPSFFFSLPIVARTDMLTCCARSAALQGCADTVALPVEVGPDPAPVVMVWRSRSGLARRAVDQLADGPGP